MFWKFRGSRFVRVVFWLLLFGDLGYSFVQYRNLPLDGDLPGLVLPQPAYENVLKHPFGLEAIRKQEHYAGPNRYFSHIAVYGYFRAAPAVLQHWVSPADSLYLAAAIAKLLIHMLILVVLAAYLAILLELPLREWIYPLILLAPFFQALGYNRVMGIIDQAVSYNFFYALPFGLLLLFLFPFFRASIRGEQRRLPFLWQTLWLAGAVVLPLSGPLIPPVVLLGCGLLLLAAVWKRPSLLPLSSYGALVLLFLISVYSMYLNTYNSEGLIEQPSLIERYLLLPKGLWGVLTKKLGVSLLLLLLVLEVQLIKVHPRGKEGRQFLTATNWIVLFSTAYILLLPLGGYREYRPNIVRYDLLLPVTSLLIGLFAWGAMLLVRAYQGRMRNWTLAGIALVFVIYTVADGFDPGGKRCEHSALLEMAKSEAEVLRLEQDCRILSWSKISEPEASQDQANFLHLMGLTRQPRPFYQPD